MSQVGRYQIDIPLLDPKQISGFGFSEIMATNLDTTLLKETCQLLLQSVLATGEYRVVDCGFSSIRFHFIDSVLPNLNNPALGSLLGNQVKLAFRLDDHSSCEAHDILNSTSAVIQ
jgi:hypothetical protein